VADRILWREALRQVELNVPRACVLVECDLRLQEFEYIETFGVTTGRWGCDLDAHSRRLTAFRDVEMAVAEFRRYEESGREDIQVCIERLTGMLEWNVNVEVRARTPPFAEGVASTRAARDELVGLAQ